MTVHWTWPLPSAETWCPSGPDALVFNSALCADLRLEFSRKAIEGLSVGKQLVYQWESNRSISGKATEGLSVGKQQKACQWESNRRPDSGKAIEGLSVGKQLVYQWESNRRPVSGKAIGLSVGKQ